MHNPVFSRPSQEELLVISDSDGVNWVFVLIQSGNKETLWTNRLNWSHFGILELPLVVLCEEETLLLATFKVGDERRLR